MPIAGDAGVADASLAHDDLLSLRVDLFPYAPCASRVWELRSGVTAYDAWYVALAEALGAPFATLDARLARASGPRCRFVLPPRAGGS
jgi:predicted nucleic acid-binding protein